MPHDRGSRLDVYPGSVRLSGTQHVAVLDYPPRRG